MPADAAHFSFWMAMLLPIDEYEKAKLLPIRSARLRLRLVVYWIEQLNSNWCVSILMIGTGVDVPLQVVHEWLRYCLSLPYLVI